MSKFTSALVAVAVLFSTALVSNSCAWTSSGTNTRFSDRDLLALKTFRDYERVSIVALTTVGEAGEFARIVKDAGGEIRVASERAGLVVAELTAGEALELSQKPRALVLTHHVALEQRFDFDFESEKLNPDTGHDNDPSSIVIDRRPENAQLPTNEMAVLAFEQEMKARFGIEVNGETVKIAVIDTGLDLAHTDVFQDRLRVSWDMTIEGRIKTAPASFDSVTGTVSETAAADSPKLKLSADIRSPSNEYFLGKVREKSYKKADLNQNGGLADEFDLLLSKTSRGWKVSIDVDRNKDFANDPAVGDFEATRETIAMDRSRSGLVKVNVNLPVKPDGTVTADDKGSVEVNVAGYDAGQHGTHVAGIAAGRFDGAQFGGHFRGGAPKAKLFGIKVLGKTGGSDADILAGIALAVDKDVDIINMSLGSARRPTDGLDSLARAIDQVARRTNVLFVISAGNNGPGMNTIGAPTTASRALSIGASVSGETWRTDYNIPQAIDAQFLWSFSARGPQDTGEIRPTLLAPGSAYSSIPLARIAGQHSGYDVMQGTSMAAPAATGAIASLLDAVRKLKGKLELPSDAGNIRWALVEGATDINSLNANQPRAPKYERFDQGAGVLNLPGTFAALEKRGLQKSIDYLVDAPSLRATYPGTARGVYSTMRLPDVVTFNVRKQASEPIDPTEHNFDREFDVTSSTAWATPQSAKVTLNGLNESPVSVTIDQATLAKLTYGVHMARIVGRHAGIQEWVFDITYVKARELTETFNRGEFFDPAVNLVPGELTRYHFFVGTDRTRLKASLRVPVIDQDGKVTDGRYRMIVSDPTGRRVLESPYATGANPFIDFQFLNPQNGVWEVIVYRSFGAKDDPTSAMLRFSTEALDIEPSIWEHTVSAGQTQLTKTFTLMSGGRTVSPIGTVELRSVGTVVPDIALVNKQKTNVTFTTPKGSRHVEIRTREVKGNANADIDLTLLLDGKEIASSGGPAADEKMEVDVPGGSALTVVVEAFDLLTQTQGAIDMELDFSLPSPLIGSTTLTGQPLARGVAKKMNASLDLTGLATGIVDDVRAQFKTVVLHGEMELFDTKQQSDTKVGSAPLVLALP